MTRNLYLGTALDNMTAASNFAEFVQAVSQDWAHVVATDFPTRAKALAAEILRAKPDVVGLQEVSLWRDQDVSDIVTRNHSAECDTRGRAGSVIPHRGRLGFGIRR